MTSAPNCTKCGSEEWALHKTGWRYCKQCNRARALAAKRKSRYGVTQLQYDSMVMEQCGLCAICGEPETATDAQNGKTRRLSVDHCHVTNKVRGLLCHRCNVAVGLLRHQARNLMSAIQYLGT